MYFNQNKLNEGKGKNDFSLSKNKEFYEGENPRESAFLIPNTVWPKNEPRIHVNHYWEKLRK